MLKNIKVFMVDMKLDLTSNPNQSPVKEDITLRKLKG